MFLTLIVNKYESAVKLLQGTIRGLLLLSSSHSESSVGVQDRARLLICGDDAMLSMSLSRIVCVSQIYN